MSSAFWSALGGKLAERWVTVSVPALIFWLSGLAAWAWHRGGPHAVATSTWLTGQPTVVQAAVIAVGLLTVAASGLAVQRSAAPMLRLLEGYWPPWADPLRRRLANCLADRAAADAAAWQDAYGRIRGATFAAEDLAAYNRLDRRRRRRPAQRAYFLPTSIGNTIQAAERRPADKYGLDAIAVWPHLWLLLPETTRSELRAARTSLDSAVAGAVWGMLFCAFAPLTWAAVPVGLAVAATTVGIVIPARAQVFGDLIEAAYDLHRNLLYQQLRWPLPGNPAEEHAAGTALTSYLRRGSDANAPLFTTAQ